MYTSTLTSSSLGKTCRPWSPYTLNPKSLPSKHNKNCKNCKNCQWCQDFGFSNLHLLPNIWQQLANWQPQKFKPSTFSMAGYPTQKSTRMLGGPPETGSVRLHQFYLGDSWWILRSLFLFRPLHILRYQPLVVHYIFTCMHVHTGRSTYWYPSQICCIFT